MSKSKKIIKESQDVKKLADRSVIVPLFIGGNGGGFDGSIAADYQTYFRRLARIDVWAGGNTFRGIELVFGHDGDGRTVKTFGTKEGNHKGFTFSADERITEFSLWGNGIGTRTGGITIKTSQGREFHHRMTDWGLRTEYKAGDLGSGICCGWICRSGSDIDAFGLAFLRPVKEIVNRIYPQQPRFFGDYQLIYDHIYVNNSNQTNNWEISRTFTRTNSIEVSVSQSTTHNFGAGIKYESPEIAALWGGKITVELTYGFSHSRTGSNSSSYSETHGIEAKQSGTIEPGQRILVTVKAKETDVQTRYVGHAVVHLNNGFSFRYNIDGLFKSKMFGSGKTESRVLNLDPECKISYKKIVEKKDEKKEIKK